MSRLKLRSDRELEVLKRRTKAQYYLPKAYRDEAEKCASRFGKFHRLTAVKRDPFVLLLKTKGCQICQQQVATGLTFLLTDKGMSKNHTFPKNQTD